MRSKWSAEFALLFFATAVLEAAWLTLANILLQWLKNSSHVALDILPFFVAVLFGMIIGRSLRNLNQLRYSIALTASAIAAGVVGALLSGNDTSSFGAFLNSAVVDPGAWLMGIAVVRGVAQADPGSGYESERVFSFGIPGLVAFWISATLSEMTRSAEFTSAAFATSLTFVAAGLLSLGLGRLRDLDVEAVDQNARRRWVGLVLAIVVVVLIVGIPLAGVLGVPVTAAVFGVLGPLAPLIVGLFTLLAIPIFALINVLVGILKPIGAPTPPPIQSAAPASGPVPPVLLPPTGAPPDLTLLLVALLIVGAMIVLRLIFLLARRASVSETGADAVETRASEPFSLPSLPRLPRLPRLSVFGRRRIPASAIEAYVFALEELAPGPSARGVGETPREHALRLQGGGAGRDVGRLATDYQLNQFAQRRLTPIEVRRAIERWRRIVERERPKR